MTDQGEAMKADPISEVTERHYFAHDRDDPEGDRIRVIAHNGPQFEDQQGLSNGITLAEETPRKVYRFWFPWTQAVEVRDALTRAIEEMAPEEFAIAEGQMAQAGLTMREVEWLTDAEVAEQEAATVGASAISRRVATACGSPTLQALFREDSAAHDFLVKFTEDAKKWADIPPIYRTLIEYAEQEGNARAATGDDYERLFREAQDADQAAGFEAEELKEEAIALKRSIQLLTTACVAYRQAIQRGDSPEMMCSLIDTNDELVALAEKQHGRRGGSIGHMQMIGAIADALPIDQVASDEMDALMSKRRKEQKRAGADGGQRRL